MSKKTVNLSLIEMFAIKHGLKMQLVIKENDLNGQVLRRCN
ncbi:hypothetical protein [Clostridium botulinum]|nr:hypothetical protein [Clostridium botulinum]